MIKNNIKSYTSIFSIFFLCFNLHSQTTVTDVSGNIYKTVKIGNQIWMAENLRTEKFRNGDPIEQISSSRFWQEITFKMMDDSSLEYSHPAMCYYNNTKLKDQALYNWYVVIDNRGICPTGWHVPSSSEFVDLLDQLGGLENALNPLKDQTSWLTNGNNSSGFKAKGIGGRTSDGTFAGDSATTGYWTDTHSGERNEYNNLLMPFANLIYLNDDNIELGSGVYNIGSSIRCVKN